MAQPEVRRRERRDELGLVSFGFFLLLIGVVYFLNPGIIEWVRDFFRSWRSQSIPGAPGMSLPVPTGNHAQLYSALETFAFIYGIFHVGILAARFALGSSVSQKASTVQGIVFWLGVGFLLDLLANVTIDWFEFVTSGIIVIGLSLIAQGAALAVGRSLTSPRV